MPLLRAAHTPTSVARYSQREFEAEEPQASVDGARRSARIHRAADILAGAEARSAELERTAHEAARADGWREGYEKGQQLGRAEAMEQCGAQLQHAAAALARLDDAVESVRGELESAALADVVKLAVAIAERVTKRAGLIDPAVLGENVREALKLAVRGGSVRVLIHPSQRELLAAILPQVQGESPAGRAFEIAGDESIAPGGCRIVTADGQIDADLQSQLDRLTDKLLPPRRVEGDKGAAAAADTGGRSA
jgi:flagellar assembly protein FliH